METRLSIHDILKNHKNWPDNVDFEEIQSNRDILGSYMNKMYFSEAPQSPEKFVVLFSRKEFALSLRMLLEVPTQTPKIIWFKEHTKLGLALKMSADGHPFIYADDNQVPIYPHYQGDEFFVDIAF